MTQQAAIGNQVINEQAGQGAIFLIVSYTSENQGQQTATAMASDFYVTDESNRKFTSATRAQRARSMVNKTDVILTQLQPGIAKQAQQVFEIPQQATQAPGLKLVIPEKGFGSGKAVIAIN